MQKIHAVLLTLCVSMCSLAGCLGGDEEISDNLFPSFETVADDGNTYSLESTNGPFIAIFSAEWCDNPCHSSMHNIWQYQEGLQVFVFSTDPDENPRNISLSDWKESADNYDDEYDENGQLADEGVTLDTYKFMKGHDVGLEIGIDRPGHVLFVNSENVITYNHKGILDDQVLIQDKWEEASA